VGFQTVSIANNAAGRQQGADGCVLGPIGYTWSYLACRIGHCVPIWQPCIGSAFQKWITTAATAPLVVLEVLGEVEQPLHGTRGLHAVHDVGVTGHADLREATRQAKLREEASSTACAAQGARWRGASERRTRPTKCRAWLCPPQRTFQRSIAHASCGDWEKAGGAR
jgi:hypothetical protein